MGVIVPVDSNDIVLSTPGLGNAIDLLLLLLPLLLLLLLLAVGSSAGGSIHIFFAKGLSNNFFSE